MFLTILPLFFMSGCIKDVKPWEKGTLAKKSMKGELNSELKRLDEHIFFSKEASKGGSGVAGGGCGCN